MREVEHVASARRSATGRTRPGSTARRGRARSRSAAIDGAHRAARPPARRPRAAAGSASASASRSAASPSCSDPALVEHDGVPGHPADHARGSARPAAPAPSVGDPRQHVGDLGDHLGRQALGRLVDEQQPVRGRAAPGPAPPSAAGRRTACRPAAAPLAQVREQLVDRVVVGRAAGALGQPQVLRDRQPGEDLAVLGHVAEPRADDPMVGCPSIPSPSKPITVTGARQQAEDRLEGGGLADAVAAEQRGDPGAATSKETPCRMCDPAIRTCTSVSRSTGSAVHLRAGQQRRPSQLLPQVGLLHGRVGHHRVRGVAASSAPWCMTAIRSARPRTTSMWCSTMQHGDAARRVQVADQRDQAGHVLRRRRRPSARRAAAPAARPASTHGDLQLALVAVRERPARRRRAGRRPTRSRQSRARRAADRRSPAGGRRTDPARRAPACTASRTFSQRGERREHASRSGRCGRARAGPAGAAAAG